MITSSDGTVGSVGAARCRFPRRASRQSAARIGFRAGPPGQPTAPRGVVAAVGGATVGGEGLGVRVQGRGGEVVGSEYQPFGDTIGELSKNLGFRSGPPGSQPSAHATAPDPPAGPRRSGSSGGGSSGQGRVRG